MLESGFFFSAEILSSRLPASADCDETKPPEQIYIGKNIKLWFPALTKT